MSTHFNHWLVRLLEHGESVQLETPRVTKAERSAVRDELRQAYERHALIVAGSSLPFAEETALRAVEWLAEACWKLVGDASEAKTDLLVIENPSAADHLSADLTLRHLPTVYRRALARSDRAALTAEIEEMLRDRKSVV